MKKIFIGIIYFIALLSIALPARSQNKITVKASQPIAAVQSTMWGIFFEDINMGADGGIYAELVKNRSFEFYKPLMGWKIIGQPTTEGDFVVHEPEPG